MSHFGWSDFSRVLDLLIMGLILFLDFGWSDFSRVLDWAGA